MSADFTLAQRLASPTLPIPKRAVRDLVSLLAEARPIVANAAADPNASPWQREVRSEILGRIDAALKEAQE